MNYGMEAFGLEKFEVGIGNVAGEGHYSILVRIEASHLHFQLGAHIGTFRSYPRTSQSIQTKGARERVSGILGSERKPDAFLSQ